MKSQKVGNRGFLFTFEKPYKTNIYVINAKEFLFIIDTFLGPNPMEKVIEIINKKDEGTTIKSKIIFNSHYDYDHVWGNNFFKNEIIIAHNLCRKILKDKGEPILKKYEEHQQGNVELIFPNLTFSKKISFKEEDIVYFYSPGHTLDSSSSFDYEDKVLFVGDNIEFPFPYIRIMELDKYIETFNTYLDFEAHYLITGHTDLIIGRKKIKNVIKSQLDYVRSFKNKSIDIKKLSDKGKILHYSNLKEYGNLLKSKDYNKSSIFYIEEAIDLLSLLPKETKGINKEAKILENILNDLKGN